MDDRQRLNSQLLFPKSETIWRALDPRVEEEAAAPETLTSLIGREVQHKQLKRYMKDFIFRYFLAHTGLSRAANKLFTAFQKSLYWFCKLLTAERSRCINEQIST